VKRAFWYLFSVGKRTFPDAIHSEIRPVYGDKCITIPAIHIFRKKFACGRENAGEKRPGWCVALTTDAAIAAVTSLIWSDRRVSISVQMNLDNMLKNKMLMFDILYRFHCWMHSFFWYSYLAIAFNTCKVVKEWAKYCTNWLCSMYTWRYNNDVSFIKISLYVSN